jgi:predicted nucleic acid-binding protein
MTVFLDTVGLLALWDENDHWHGAAKDCFIQPSALRANVITTTFIILECVNASARRPYRSAVSQLRQELERGQRLITPTPEDWQTAWNAYDLGGANSAGIVDHITFAVMRRMGISKTFTNDQHFHAAGFETLF